MKTLLYVFVSLFIFTMGYSQNQNNKRKSLAVLNIDCQNINMTPEQMGNLVRIEIDKLDSFEVMDRYDVKYLIDKHKLNIGNCYGKICLVEVGETINSEKLLTGSVELLGENIVVTLRLIDVKSSAIEKTKIMEFLNLQKELPQMVRITLQSLFGLQIDKQQMEQLTRQNLLENQMVNPNKDRLNLTGPRMGATVFTGKTAEIMSESKDLGGYNAYPVMFQFGYQFEVQYLNSSNWQALFEFVPNVTGLDQNIFIPSLTIMNGLRNNVNGWEIGLGPIFSIVKRGNGYYDESGAWYGPNTDISQAVGTLTFAKRLDNRGTAELNTGFIFAIGKTFRSGKLNIPVNAYVVPHIDGIRFGVSFGYNAKNK